MERKTILAKKLLQANGYLSASSLSKQLNVSSKTVRSDLDNLNDDLAQYGLELIRKPGRGVRLDGAPAEKRTLLEKIERYSVNTHAKVLPRQLDLFMRVVGSEAPVYVKQVAGDYFVSRATVQRDLEHLNQSFLTDFDLKILNTSDGLHVAGTEANKRAALARAILKKCDDKLHSMAVGDDTFIQYLQTLIGLDIGVLVDFINRVEDDFGIQFIISAQRDLLIHVAVTITRIQANNTVVDTKRIQSDLGSYHEELNILKKDVRGIESTYKIEFDDQELYLLLLHVVSSKQADGVELGDYSAKLREEVKQLIEKVSEDSGNDFVSDPELYKSLLLHLKIATTRVRFGLKIENPFYTYVIEHNFDLFIVLKNNVGLVFADQDRVPDTEIAFMTIHFMASLERIQKKPRVFVLCASGLGVSQLLLERVRKYFPYYDVVDSIGIDELGDLSASDADLIISTVDLQQRTVIPYVVIDPMEDLKDVRTDIQMDKAHVRKMSSSQVLSFSLGSTLQLDNFTSKKDVITKVSDWLVSQGKATAKYADALIAREEIGSTYIGDGIALIHGKYMENSLGPSLSIIRLGHSIQWDQHNKVDLLFNFIPTSATKKEFALLFRRMGQTIDDRRLWDVVKSCQFPDMVEALNKEFDL